MSRIARFSSSYLKRSTFLGLKPSVGIARSFSGTPRGPNQHIAISTRGLYKTGDNPLSTKEELKDVVKPPISDFITEQKHLIHVRGPMTMAEWMQYCLGHPKYGYYMQRDAIGKRGDFITNPEISSIYGEQICVWCVSTWMSMGSPKNMQLIELGPGRGTLMNDILTAAESFPEFYQSLHIHFVENSGLMRDLQKNALKVELDTSVLDSNNSHNTAVRKVAEKTLEKMAVIKPSGEVSNAKDGADALMDKATEAINEIFTESLTNLSRGAADANQASALAAAAEVEDVMTRPIVFGKRQRVTKVNAEVLKNVETHVQWHWSLHEIPSTMPCIIVGHEFLDALPVNQFKYTSKGWREILVDIDNGTGPHHFKYVLSQEPTPMTKVFASPMSLFGAPVPDDMIKTTVVVENKNTRQSTSNTTVNMNTVKPDPKKQTIMQAHDGFPGFTEQPAGTGNQVYTGEATKDVLGFIKKTSTQSNVGEEKKKMDDFKKPNKTGDTYEVSPAVLNWSEQISVRLMKSGGAALLIDYGDNDTGFVEPDNIYMYSSARFQRVFRELSLQGIKSHGHADVLQEPGYVDLSAHVNFGAVAAVARRTVKQLSLLLSLPEGTPERNKALMLLNGPGNTDKKNLPTTPEGKLQLHNLNTYTAIPQGEFLQKLGIETRFEKLLQTCTSQEEAEMFYNAVNRLVDPEQMGTLFKVMAITTKDVKTPVGWTPFSLAEDK